MRSDQIYAEIKSLTAEIESLQQKISHAEAIKVCPISLLARHQELTGKRYKLHQTSSCNSELPQDFRHIGEVLQEIQGASLPGVI